MKMLKSGDGFIVESARHESGKIKRIMGGKHKKGVWHLPSGWETAKCMRALYGPSLEMDEETRQWAVRHKNLRDRVNQIKNETCGPEKVLYGYQRTGVNWMVAMCQTAGGCILTDEMGLGKTLQAIETTKILGGFPALIVCPATLKKNWEQEFNKWAPELNVTVIEGAKSRRVEQLENEADVYIMNYESLPAHSKLSAYTQKLSEEESRMKELNHIDIKTIILDEAHKIKSPKAKRTQAVWQIAKDCDYRIAMTGTPISNNISDLWSILKFCDPKVWSGKTKFLDWFAIVEKNWHGGITIKGVKEEAKDLFDELVGYKILRRHADEVLDDLPDVTRQTRYCKMGRKQTAQYKSLLDDRRLDCAHVTDQLTASLRLHQLAQSEMEVECGEPVELEDWTIEDEEIHTPDKFTMTGKSPKIEVLKELLDDIPGQMVVFSHSKQLAYQAASLIDSNKRYGGGDLICGDVPVEDRQPLIDRFQNGEFRVLVCTLATASEGITLTAAKSAVFLQRSFSLPQNLQAEARIRRIGSKHQSVSIVDVITEGTVDSLPSEALKEKKGILNEVLQSPGKILEWANKKAKIT